MTAYEIALRGDWVTVPVDCTDVVFAYEARREQIRERFLQLNRIGCTTWGADTRQRAREE